VAVLRNPAEPGEAALWRETQIAGQQLRIKLQSLEVHNPREFEHAISLMVKSRADAFIIQPDPLFFASLRQIADLARRHRLPAIADFREFVDAGGLMSYGASVPDIARRVATFVDKLLKGAKAGDLPIEQPTKFELLINLKTANALALTIPPSVLLRA